MSQMEIDSVLAQIRSLSAQTRLNPTAISDTQKAGAGAGAGVSEFANVLKKGIDQVNQTQVKATALADAFDRGTPGVELPQVMLEMQKASVSFRALTEVRNRLVTAYQDIMNMPL
jgi:flagellar hook-basal body complex protein FliE